MAKIEHWMTPKSIVLTSWKNLSSSKKKKESIHNNFLLQQSYFIIGVNEVFFFCVEHWILMQVLGVRLFLTRALIVAIDISEF